MDMKGSFVIPEQPLNLYKLHEISKKEYEEQVFIDTSLPSSLNSDLLSLYACGKSLFRPGYKSKFSTFCFTLEILTEGRMNYFCGTESWSMSPGDIVMAPPRRKGSFVVKSANSARKMYLLIYSGRLANVLFHSNALYQCQYLKLSPEENLLPLFEKIWQFCMQGDSEQILRISNTLFEIISKLIYKNSERTNNDNHDIARNLENLLNTSFGRQFSVKELALQIGVSRRTLFRIFQKYFQCSPIGYIRKKRMEYAAYLLTHTDTPIRIIAGECGYYDPLPFSQIFTGYFGISPGNYRKKMVDKQNLSVLRS